MNKPACIYYEQCGGCSRQHLSPDVYLHQKQRMLHDALSSSGYHDVACNPVERVLPASRRRVEFKVAVNKDKILLGFYRQSTHDVVDIAACPVALPAIQALIEPLKILLQQFKKPGLVSAVHATAYDVGMELIFKVKSALHQADSERLQHFGEGDVARIAVQEVSQPSETAKILFTRQVPQMRFGDVMVEMPLGAFIQATEAGQHALTNAALEVAAPHKKIADIYAGCGTYSFAMAQMGAVVSAFEGVEEMVLSANNAAKKAGLTQHLHAECRDLVKQPLSSASLAQYDAVVINPPRAGASKQSREVAASGVKEVVMISCNPKTLATDLTHFKQRGYEVEYATPVDQFLWSSHLESVVRLVRG